MQCSWVNFLNTQVFDDEIRNEDYFYYQLHSGEVFVDHITANDQCGFCLQLLLPNARKQALYAPYTGHIWRTENAGRNCWHCSKQAAWSIIFDFALLETFYHVAETDDLLDICNRKSFFQLPFSINFEMTIVSFQIVSLFFRLKKDAMPLKSSLWLLLSVSYIRQGEIQCRMCCRCQPCWRRALV